MLNAIKETILAKIEMELEYIRESSDTDCDRDISETVKNLCEAYAVLENVEREGFY